MSDEHAPGRLEIPAAVERLSGEPRAPERQVALVVSRFNGRHTNRLLESALAELDRCAVPPSRVAVVEVAGAFELPAAASRLARTGRYACVVALGCVVRGETAHFEYVARTAASGLQATAVDTGVPVGFGVLTVDTDEQAEARAGAGAAAVRSVLELADLFSRLDEQ